MSNVVQMPVKSTTLMQCSACGAEANASCNCGAPYIPAGARAAEAIAKNPEKSDRAIAEEIGVHKNTVARARESTGPQGPVGKRTGRDGKKRRPPEQRARNKDLSPQVRSSLAAEVLDKGRTLEETAKKAGVSAQIIKTAIAREEGRREAAQHANMVSVQLLIEKLDPLFEEASTAANATNNNTLGTAGLRLKNVLQDIANRGRKFLNECASGDETVRLTPGLKADKRRRDRARDLR